LQGVYGGFGFASPCQPLQAIDCEQNEERRQQQNHANGGGLRGPEVVELDDNLQRRDLRLAGNISGDEDPPEPYSPIARAKANAKPLSQAGKISGKTTRRKIVHLLAPKLKAAYSCSVSQSRSTGCRPHYERQADED
jgi:hypothetical protein